MRRRVERVGNAVYKRFRRWLEIGIWEALFRSLPHDLEALKNLLFDSTVIRAHPHAAGASAEKGGKTLRPWAAAAAVSAPKSTWRRPMTRPRWRSC
jgi:transposase